MHWHIETDIISLIAACLLLIYQIRLHPQNRRDEHTRRFCACFIVCIAATVIDVLASVAMESAISRLLYHLMMTLYLILIEQVILSWFFFSLSILYQDSPKTGQWIERLSLALYAVYVLLALSNPWTGLFYTLGEHMEYRRGPLFSLMVLLFIAYTAVLILLTVLRRKHIPKRYSGLVLILIPFALAVAIFFQLRNNGWLVILPAYTVCLLMAFLFLQSREMKEQSVLVAHLSVEAATDKLTGLLNRAGGDNRIHSVDLRNYEHCLIIVVDVDGLKTINDGLGHEAGDRALIAIARRLKAHFRANDIVARYGGDEFIACLLGTFTSEQVLSSLEALCEKLNHVPIDDTPDATVSASIGASYGRLSQRDIAQLLHQADVALYDVKRNGKNGFCLYEENEKEHKQA